MKTSAMRNQTDRNVTICGGIFTAHMPDITGSSINLRKRNLGLGPNCDQELPWQIWL